MSDREAAGGNAEPSDNSPRTLLSEPWIAIGDAARHLAIPTRTMYRLAESHRVPAVKIGRTWRFKRSALDAFLSPGEAHRDEPALAQASPHVALTAVDDADPDVAATLMALADLSLELAGLTDPAEIAACVSGRLRPIFGVEVAGLLRFDGASLVTIPSTEGLALPAGTRFSLGELPSIAAALETDEPCVHAHLALPAALAEWTPQAPAASAVFVRVRSGDRPWGVLALATVGERTYAPVALDRLRSIAGQIGLALSNARLVTETRRWSDQLERIEALSRQLSGARAVEAVADAVATQIESVIDWHGLRFYLLQPDGVTLEPIELRSKVAHYSHEAPDLVRLRLGEGLGGHIALSGIAEIVNDALHDPRTRQIAGTDEVDESMIVVPFRYEDTILGVMELFRLGRDAFDATDLRLAQIIGDRAAVALFNARQLEELERGKTALERRLASQRQLIAITERLLVHRQRGTVFDAIADTLAEVVPHDTLTIYLVDRAAGCLVPTLARDVYATEILATRPPLGSGITGDVIEKGEAEIINDAVHDARVVVVPGTPADQQEAMIVAPIHSPAGVIGALNLYRVGRDFDAEDLELVRLFANHVAIALENASIHDRLSEAAVTDALTGLPNRRFFAERVDHALARRTRSGTGVAVLFLDLDGFKLINDSLGHAAGDAVLQGVAGRLRECMRTADTVARLGGDEFAILLEDVQAQADAIAASERVVGALAEPLEVAGRDVSVRASMGVALDRGVMTVTATELLRDADTAMYHAKANSRGRFELFEVAMHARQMARLELEAELREALARDQFALVYQPIVALATGRIVGAEALVRWRHPTRALGPQDFIALVEETGDIVPLGAWVIHEACRQTRAWQLLRPELRAIGISVNTSARELVEPSFAQTVATALAASGLSAEHLTLEITESVMLTDETVAVAALRVLRATGVHIALDDFGTGYSSLGYLRRLPADGIKIDQSFTAGLGRGRERAAIVRAMLNFARALGLAVTAEGVESVEQLRRLRALRCDLGQGYLFAPPLDPEAMTALLDSGRSFPVPSHRTASHGESAA
jgi:diguanylate cyclase (GGDEF)-like protein/excisionase family DNA binding protein